VATNSAGEARSDIAALTVRNLAAQTFIGPAGSSRIVASLTGQSGIIGGSLNGAGFLVSFTLQADGSFRTDLISATAAPAPEIDGRRVAAASAAFVISGRIVDGVLIANVEATGENFSIAAEPATGSTAGLSGYYGAPALNGSSTSSAFFVGSNGQLVTVSTTNGKTEVTGGTITPAGQFNVATTAGVSLTGTINPASGSVQGTRQDSSGSVTGFSGVSTAVIPTDRLVNLSTRAPSGDDERTMIAGFVVGGSQPKSVLIRAAGPALTTLGLAGAMEDPLLTIFRGNQPILSNDNWGSTTGPAIATVATRVGAFNFAPGSKDAAILATLDPGAYTAQVTRTTGSANGVALVEVYDASIAPGEEPQRLINISSRGEVRAGDGLMIAGFVVTGNAPKKVLIRGIGPSLAAFGVAQSLSKPLLRLYQGATLVVTNSNWAAAENAAAIQAAATQVGAFALQPGSADSALLLTLAPGAYTAQLSGADGGTGIALIEVYEVP
jgi:hypothetical protein